MKIVPFRQEIIRKGPKVAGKQMLKNLVEQREQKTRINKYQLQFRDIVKAISQEERSAISNINVEPEAEDKRENFDDITDDVFVQRRKRLCPNFK